MRLVNGQCQYRYLFSHVSRHKIICIKVGPYLLQYVTITLQKQFR